MDHLLHLVHSDGAQALKLHVGLPPVVVMDGKEQPLDEQAITMEEAERLLLSISTTRQRRDLWERGWVDFIYRFRNRVSFVVHAQMENRSVKMEIH
jgi:Tfp pilus assembly ATPase PilU